MPDDPQKPDSLDDDRTFAGQENEAAKVSKSLGAEATRGDAGDSSEDEFQQVLDAFDEVIELEKRYDVQGKLGAGGMGTVLKAVDKRLGRTVALKFLLKELGNSAQALRRFMTEAKAIATLNHNNIVQIYEMERSAEGPYIVMEYVEGGSLVDLLKGGPLELDKAVDIICQVCDGLSAAHDQGITHRDIKPANILITTTGIPKLSDFGLARQSAEDHGQTKVGAVLGTIDFMPPEQRQDATTVDARSDLWSLGATFYQMVTGKLPKIINFKNVPLAVQDVLGKALEEEKDDRYQTATEFRDALRASLRSNDSQSKNVFALEKNNCPNCQTENDDVRRFCRNPDCAEPLKVSCFGCEQEISIWEVICGQCGENQKDLFLVRRTELDAKRDKAITLRSELWIEESIRIAREISRVDDSRLQHLKEWADTFIETAKDEIQRKQSRVEESYSAAKKHHQAFDYPSAISALEAIPSESLNTEMSVYL
ncbi:MAG: serine/threonine-protein kinase, partial [Pirellulaceae bacterium]